MFDVSKPWLNRLIEDEERAYLKAVSGVSFAIGRRETLALVGESGSASRRWRAWSWGLQPTAGAVTIDGIDLCAPRLQDMRRRKRQRLRRRLQMIFQDPFASLNPRWRVAASSPTRSARFGLAEDRREIEHRVAELAPASGAVPADGGQIPHEFSGGQRQRICIARALSSTPSSWCATSPPARWTCRCRRRS